MPKFGSPGQVGNGSSPQKGPSCASCHPVEKCPSGPVIPSKPTRSRACPVFRPLTRQPLNGAGVKARRSTFQTQSPFPLPETFGPDSIGTSRDHRRTRHQTLLADRKGTDRHQIQLENMLWG